MEAGSTEGADQAGKQVENLQHLLEAKQEELRGVLASGGDSGAASAEQALLEQQREEYGRRGISLACFATNVSQPHFVNLDEVGNYDLLFVGVKTCSSYDQILLPILLAGSFSE
jgi:hypothetical protein